MDTQFKQRLTSRDVWMRALYMVFFVIAYSLAELIIAFLVVFQFLTILVSGRANERLLRFGNNLSTYVYQLLQFLTFNSEDQPFPFADWPDEQPRANNRWARVAEPTRNEDDMGDRGR